ncbi:Lymphokine-activated killer T-cell-originated protein kinase, partial [Egretta garzetta]
SVTIPASPFMQKLGSGTGVNVYLMKRSPRGLSRSPWAVKKIYSKCKGGKENVYQQRLNDEAKILKNLQHPNIVGYRAFTKANDGSMCLAMEYGGEKSLSDLIDDRATNQLGPFPAATIFKVALSMARGLKYLHNDKKLLHGDIKSSNVVVKGDFEAVKICDVGLSMPLDDNMTVSEPEMYYIGTEPWRPKEALQEDGVITDKADIYAFGLTLWEMMTLSMPHIDIDEHFDEEEGSFNEAYYAALGTRPPLNMDELGPSYHSVVCLFYVCTSENPAKRPSAAWIVEALEEGPAPE